MTLRELEGKQMSSKLTALVGIGAAILLSACAGPGHVKSHGHLHSLGGLKAGKIDIEANSCDGIENSRGHVKIKDKYAIDWEHVRGISLKGTVDSTYYCSLENEDSDILCNCNEGYQEVQFSYTSKNHRAPGEGTGVACLADIGDGKDQGDNGIAEIQILSGPYEGYHNVGATRVKQLTCE